MPAGPTTTTTSKADKRLRRQRHVNDEQRRPPPPSKHDTTHAAGINENINSARARTVMKYCHRGSHSTKLRNCTRFSSRHAPERTRARARSQFRGAQTKFGSIRGASAVLVCKSSLYLTFIKTSRRHAVAGAPFLSQQQQQPSLFLSPRARAHLA